MSNYEFKLGDTVRSTLTSFFTAEVVAVVHHDKGSDLLLETDNGDVVIVNSKYFELVEDKNV